MHSIATRDTSLVCHSSTTDANAKKVWIKDMHTKQVSGAVWFKHKYLTNSSVTPEDQIVAAIGGLAKTLTTGVPPQLWDNTVDKLCKLQEILEPRMDGNDERKIMAPMQQVPILRQSPRLAESNNHNPAAFPRVARDYAMLPRVLEKNMHGYYRQVVTTAIRWSTAIEQNWQNPKENQCGQYGEPPSWKGHNESPEQPGPEHT
jgi:hypothetical protein